MQSLFAMIISGATGKDLVIVNANHNKRMHNTYILPLDSSASRGLLFSGNTNLDNSIPHFHSFGSTAPAHLAP
jgi:hypothetical protein